MQCHSSTHPPLNDLIPCIIYLNQSSCHSHNQVSEAQRYGLVRAVSYLYSRDFDRLASTFVDLGFVTNTEDPAALEGLGPALRDAFSNATGGDEGRGESLLDLNFAKLSSNIADVAYRFPIRIPPYWSLVIRCLTILEGKRSANFVV